MNTLPQCVYDDCDGDAKVVRVVEVSGRELVYCREHDPLREESDYQWAFTER